MNRSIRCAAGFQSFTGYAGSSDTISEEAFMKGIYVVGS